MAASPDPFFARLEDFSQLGEHSVAIKDTVRGVTLDYNWLLGDAAKLKNAMLEGMSRKWKIKKGRYCVNHLCILILTSRTYETVAAILAIMAAGGVAVPPCEIIIFNLPLIEP